jgi:uncharacterized protein YdcH (DUF465 family)
MNERIRLANKEKKLNIPEINRKQIQTEEFRSLISRLEKNDQKFGRLPTNEVLKLDLRNKIRLLIRESFGLRKELLKKKLMS